MTTKKSKDVPGGSQDVEGQGYLLDPIMARQIAHDRQKDMERSTAERARRKEARPNKQQP